MTAAEPHRTVIEALNAVMGEVRGVGKNQRNSAQNFQFRGIDDVVNAVGPALRNHGVVVVPVVEEATYSTAEVGAKKTQMREVTLRVRYKFYGPQGDHLEAVVYGEALDSGDKATTKALSQAFKYALVQTLAIPTNEADADSQSYERAPAGPRYVPNGTAKTRLLAALGGDKAAAATWWADRDHVTEDEIEELIVEAVAAQQAPFTDEGVPS